MTKLNISNGVSYDLKVFSDSVDGYIDVLSDGTFKVYIPLTDEMIASGNLVAYYVKDDEPVQEFNITIEGNYGVFVTNHFSTYTISTGVNNPKTADDIVTYVSMLAVSVGALALVGFGLYLRKKKINKIN